jgi:RNA polymerase sigma factor (sigma-70 family)
MEGLPEAATDHDSVADRLDALELERAVASLPPAQQVVIRLRFYLGLSFREIGANLSISTNTAASRARYALAGLRRRLGAPHPGATREDRHE